MAPLKMNFIIQERQPSSLTSNYIIVKLKYPMPNMIRIYANDQIIDPILLTDQGLRRSINVSRCGDNIYYYVNRTTNFVVKEGDCSIRL